MDVTLQFDALISDDDGGSGGDGDDCLKVVSFVDALDEHRTLPSYNAAQLKSIAAYLSRTLNGNVNGNYSDLLGGLSLLGVVVEQSSTDAFAELHTGWVQSLVRTLNKTDWTVDPGVRLLASKILTLVFEHASIFPEFMRQLSMTVVPQLVQQQLTISINEDDDFRSSDVILILAILRHFPGACRAHVSALRRRIINLLLSSDGGNAGVRESATVAAKCLSLLPWVGNVSSGKKMGTDASWSKLYAQLCGSLHLVLDAVYDGYEQEREASYPAERLEHSLLVGNDRLTDGTVISCRTLRNLLMCVHEMLTVNTDVEPLFTRVVPIEDTMGLICRILNVNLKTMASRGDNRTLVTSLTLPEIHRSTLSVLKCLLNICGRHMSLHGTSVLGIVAKTLQWTSEISVQGMESADYPLGRLRVASYDVLVTWLDVVHSSTSLAYVEALLIRNLLNDVTPKRDAQSLVLGKSNSGASQRVKKKVKREFESVVDVVNRKVSPWSDSELCLAALDALAVVLCYGAEVLQTRFLKDIHETTVKLCRNVQMSSSACFPIPYGNPKCRRALYELLIATVVHRTPTFSPDLSACIGIFSRGVTLNGGHKIGRSCAQALTICHLLTNPHRPSTYPMASAAAELTRPSVEESEIDLDDVIGAVEVPVGPDSCNLVAVEEVDGAKSSDYVEIVIQDDGPDENVSPSKEVDNADPSAVAAPPSGTYNTAEVNLCDEEGEEKQKEETNESSLKMELETVDEGSLSVDVVELDDNEIEPVNKPTVVDHRSADDLASVPPAPEELLEVGTTVKMMKLSFVDCLPDA